MADPKYDIDFWEALVPEGERPISMSELSKRVGTLLETRPEYAQLPDADTLTFYSARSNGTSMNGAAVDLARQSDGAFGAIDNTTVGRNLGGLWDLSGQLQGLDPDSADAQRILEQAQARYGEFVKLDEPGQVIGSREFGSRLYESFDAPSNVYSRSATGDVVTLIPEATVEGAFYREELPNIVEGLAEGRIDRVNGVPAEAFSDLIETYRADPGAPGALDPFFERFKADIGYQIEQRGVDGLVEDYVEGRDVPRRPLDAAPARPDATDASRPDVTPDTVPDATPNAGLDGGGQASEAPRSGSVLDGAEADVRASTAAGASAADLADAGAGNLFDTDAIRRLGEASEAGQVRAFTADPDGRTAYLLDRSTGTMMEIENGRIVSANTFDSVQDANLAFGAKLDEAGRLFPEAFDGLPRVSGSLGEFAEHMDDIRAPGWVRSLAGTADEGASFLGKASKVLGPLGVAAAGYEVYNLESQLVDYSEMGLVSAEAVWAYRGVLTAHAAQATVDPSLVGGEVVVQEAYDAWVEHYDIPPTVAEALEPGSLLEDLDSARQWLGDRAEEAGVAIEEYATTRWNDPSLMIEDFRRVGRLGERIIGDAYERGAELAGEMQDYAQSRWEDPSLLADDAASAANTAWEGIKGAGNWVWDNTFGGGDEPDATTQILGEDPAMSVTVPLEDAARQFVLDREAAREAGDDVSAFEDPALREVFDRAQTHGVEAVTVEVREGMTYLERAEAIAKSVHDAGAEAERSNGLERAAEPAPEAEAELDAAY